MAVRIHNNVVRDFVNMADSMNRMRAAQGYDYAHNGGHNGNTVPQQERTARLPLDVWGDEEAFFIKAYVPGINVKDVEITFEDETLTISGNRPESDPDTRFIKRELHHGRFERTLSFNVPINVDGIEAALENGVLTLTVPKAEEVRPKRIEVRTK